MSIKKSQATLKYFIDLKQARREGGGGATGALIASHRPQRSIFCLPTTDLKQSESIIFFNSYSLIVSCSKFESQNLF